MNKQAQRGDHIAKFLKQHTTGDVVKKFGPKGIVAKMQHKEEVKNKFSKLLDGYFNDHSKVKSFA